MIKGIMFDLYDTLIYINRNIYKGYRSKLAWAIGAPTCEIEKIWGKYIKQRFSGEISTLKEMLEILLRELGKNLWNVNMNELEDIQTRALIESVRSYSGVEDMLKRLKNQGIQLALVSNASYSTKFVIDNLPWIKIFNHVILSYKVKMIKPHPEIYESTLKKMNVLPNQCFFVGDGGSLELDGAKNVGIPTVRVVQKNQDPSFERSVDADFRINSITELPWLIQLFNQKTGGKQNWIF